MSKKKSSKKEGPKQKSLPGMEDRKIEALQAKAEEYAEVRDQRMELLDQEVELKGALGKLMHEHGLKTYRYHGVEVILEPGEENVKVKIKKEKPAKPD